MRYISANQTNIFFPKYDKQYDIPQGNDNVFKKSTGISFGNKSSEISPRTLLESFLTILSRIVQFREEILVKRNIME